MIILSIDCKVKKKEKIRNPYNQILQDTIWENDKNTRKHHKQEGQELSPFQGHKDQTR